MPFLNKFFFLFSLLTTIAWSQTDTSKLVLKPIETLNQKLFSPTLPIPEDPNAVDNKRTDSLRNCTLCKEKLESYTKLKKRLKFSIDSITKVIDYLNKYENGPYFYYLLIEEISLFDWGVCVGYFTNSGSLILRYSYSSHGDEGVVHCNFKIMKYERFRIRLDGLSDSQTFYREDLH
ncbi:MAG TPA: hypothetical protein VNX01_03145 [Bacteroidia bacterium]|jgi:hypothetical protein|nr:hypothetical protein [Bacteroidia bacterium]